MDKSETDTDEAWPDISERERIQHELLFYSQGPLNGYLLGEKARDLFLHSKLPLMVLSKIWNLADISHDNLLSVEEFVLVMHLIQGVLRGNKIPQTLPENLTPSTPPSVGLPAMSDGEKQAYCKVFQSYDSARKGQLSGTEAALLFKVSKLPPEQLACVWNWCDVNRDGNLDLEEWTVACHLIRHLKQGGSLDGTVNPFEYLPDKVSPTSLQARKARIEEYERHKQRLMLLKEKRKTQITRETKRLHHLNEKCKLEKQLYDKLKFFRRSPVTEEEFNKVLAHDKDSAEKLEEIVARLKKEHEKVRQETVKVILGEQKLQFEHTAVKSETEELNKRLETHHSTATKDPDPFHQLYEQRKEERKKSNLSEGEEPEIHIPFKFNPFDKESLHHSSLSGSHLFLNSHADNNNSKVSEENLTLFSDLHEFGEKFLENWCSVSQSSSNNMDAEEDPIFMTVEVKSQDDCYLGVNWKEGTQGLEDASFLQLHKKLVDLRSEMQKLNAEAGGKMIFRNPSDYLARKKEKEEEEQKEKSKFPRRSKSSADKDSAAKRRSYVIERKKDESDVTGSDKRYNRRSLNLEQTKAVPERPRQAPSRVSDSHVTSSGEQRRRERPLSAEVKAEAGQKTTSPSTSPTRLSSSKKTRAPPPPCTSASGARAKSNPTSPSKESKIPIPQSPSKDTPKRPPRAKGRSPPAASPTEEAPSSGRKSFLFGNEVDDNKDIVSDDSNLEKSLNCEKEVISIQTEVTEGDEDNTRLAQVQEDLVVDANKVSVKSAEPVTEVREDIVVPVEKVKEECENVISPFEKLDEISVGSEPKLTNGKPDVPLTESNLTKKDNPAVSIELTIKVNGIQREDDLQVKQFSNTEEDQMSIPESVDSKKESATANRDNLSLDIPNSDTVSLCSVDSIPPELPQSEPPNLPGLGQPNGLHSPIEEEILEIVTSPRVESSPKEIVVIQDPAPKSELKTEYCNSLRTFPAKMDDITLEEIQTNGKGLDDFVNELAIEVKAKKQLGSDDDSDLSDLENQNGSFSPGDSSTGGHVATAPDHDADDPEIQLLSFNNTDRSIQSPNSQTDSAFDEMMSSMHSNDPDGANHTSFGNTMEEVDVEEDVIVVAKKVEVVESTPPAPPDTVLEEEEEDEPVRKNEPAKEEEQGPVEKEEEETETPPETPRIQLKDERLKEIQMRREPVTFVRKAQQFSEIVNEPPKVRIRATTKGMSDDHLREVDRERKAVISQSTVRRREVDETETVRRREVDDAETVRPGTDLEEETKPTVELKKTSGWTREVNGDDSEESVVKAFNTSVNWEEKPPKVDLYSSNVIKEDETSESVDRESIADLHSTRKQWESLLKSTGPEPAAKPTPKKSTPVKHWEVKLPYKPTNTSEVPVNSTQAGEVNSQPLPTPELKSVKMDDDPYANESAIEREIRLANEREEMLRKEQEERMELVKRQNASKTQINTAAFEQKEDNNNSVMYHEMTEADRGSELKKMEDMMQQELEEQKEREIALKVAPQASSQEEKDAEDKSTETLIAREIRLQKEREEEIARQYRKEAPVKEVVTETVVEVVETTPSEMPQPQTNGLPSRKDITYEEAIGNYQHEGESLIARELREAREREEELQRLRQRGSQKPVVKQAAPQQQSPPPKPAAQELPAKKTWPSPSPSVQTPTISSHSVSKTVKVTPTPDSETNDDSAEKPKPKKETPIEREIRIARERENELRRSKGLPELKAPEPEPQEDSPSPSSSTDSTVVYRNRLRSEDSSSKMKQFATSQLHRELKSQKEKEMTLKNEGKIISTSEDHIGTPKYTEVAGISKSDGPVKRNFVTRKSVSSLPVPPGSESPGSSKTPSENGDVDQGVLTSQVSREEPKYKRPTVKSGGASFSYRESRHQAESKIEKELREMREREEELKQARERAGIVSPDKPDSPRDNSFSDRKAQFEQTS